MWDRAKWASDSDRHISQMAVGASKPYPLIIMARITSLSFNQTFIQKGFMYSYNTIYETGNICGQTLPERRNLLYYFNVCNIRESRFHCK